MPAPRPKYGFCVEKQSDRHMERENDDEKQAARMTSTIDSAIRRVLDGDIDA